MPANFTQVIGATAAQRHQLGVGILLNIYFVKGAVYIVLHPKYNGAHELIMFDHFYITE
jgi:hypothetical protein